MAQSVAITGQGIICAIGADCASVLSSLLHGESGIRPMRHLESAHTELPVGEVKMSNQEMKSLLGVPLSSEVSRTSLLGAIALRQALASASLSAAELAGKRLVFVSGTTVGGMDVTERHYSAMLSDAEAAKLAMRHDCGSNTQEIAELCGLNAKKITISTACSSALNAIVLGTRLLLAGKADVVVAGGSEALSRFHLNGFNSLMILDHDACRPFDKSRQGLNLGEGAAYVVLERGSDSKLRDIPALGFVGGYGNRCDAFHQTATSENGEGAYLAMLDALEMSGLDKCEIDYINAHGTGTPDNDRSESRAISRLFGVACPPVSSTKSFTGHTTSASGGIETVISLLAMRNGFIPANLNWSEKDSGCIVPSLGKKGVKLHNVLCNSFGFGGNDSALIISDSPVMLTETDGTDVCASVTPVTEISSQDDLAEAKKYVSPMESRRMSKIMKAAVLTSMKALELAGIDSPDAIIVGTAYGMLHQGEKILDHLAEQGEDGLSPTLFMQSTHNTIAGTLAVRLKCHGYNITYSQGDDSWHLALADAVQLIAEGKARHVLVGRHDYCPERFRRICELAGRKALAGLVSKSVVVSRRSNNKGSKND